MFPSQDVQYNNRDDAVTGDDGAGKNDDIGSDATPMDDNFDRSHPLYRLISGLADLTRAYPALRNGAQQHRYSTDGPGIYAFSRIDRREQHEYVVALNNSKQEQIAAVPTWMPSGAFTKLYGVGARHLASDAAKRLQVTVPPLSTVVYRADAAIPRSGSAPALSIAAPAEGGSGRDRLEVVADVGGQSFYEVTFLAKVGSGGWREIGTDDNAPYRVFHDVAGVAPGTPVQYRAVVLDDAGHQRGSAIRDATVAPPAITLEAPTDNGRVRGRVEVRATATPELPSYVVTFQRSVNGGAFHDIGTDDSSPVYTAFDDTAGQPDGATLTYRAVLTYAPGRSVVSATRSVTVVNTPVTTAVVHYNRPAADYADWGLHLWGDAIGPGVATDWGAPRQRDGIDGYGAFFDIPLQDDTKPVNFIVHRPSGDSVPATREPGGDRSFVPLEHPQIWLKQGDPTVYYSPPPLP
jgi:hypothetical protein